MENIVITSFAISTQHCEIKFHSYGYTVKDYTLMWDRGMDGKVTQKRGIRENRTKCVLYIFTLC